MQNGVKHIFYERKNQTLNFGTDEINVETYRVNRIYLNIQNSLVTIDVDKTHLDLRWIHYVFLSELKKEKHYRIKPKETSWLESLWKLLNRKNQIY